DLHNLVSSLEQRINQLESSSNTLNTNQISTLKEILNACKDFINHLGESKSLAENQKERKESTLR
ncbi:MAG: hypothetical protein AB7V32_09275, partial [Candidatus Berkiella sp.]